MLWVGLGPLLGDLMYNNYSFTHFQVPDELLQEAKAAAKAALEEMDAD